MTLQHQCPRDGCYKDKLPDWGMLDGCFPRGIRPSDVDGIVEMNERVLMLEWKPARSTLKTGQRLLFLNMTRGSPLIQVLVIYGDVGVPDEIELYQGGSCKFRQACDLEFLRWFCMQWGIFSDTTRGAGLAPPNHDRRWRHRRSIERGLPTQLRLSLDMRRLPDRRAANAR